MKHNSLTLLLAATMMLLAGVQTAKAQKVVLHMAGNQTFECSVSQLDSITFEEDDLIIEEEHEWVDLDLPSGTLWATCNVGASSPEEYGSYFAWGETEPKEEYSWSTYIYCKGDYNTLTKYCHQSECGYNGFTDTLTELEPKDDAATANWGNGWQMPSLAQLQELFDKEYTTATWTTQSGVNGRLITSKGNGKSIFLPAAGEHYDATFDYDGRYGDYWSRSINVYASPYADAVSFNSSSVYWEDHLYRYRGKSVRPVRVHGNPKIRIGIYETIPGYSVQNLEFYADAATDITQTNCVLYADADEETFSIDFGTLNYTTTAELMERFATYYLGRSSNQASFAGNAADNYYTTCMPNESGINLNLRVDYTLESTDGSGEVIHVTNASAQVPAKYTKWESGRAYTYIFKIHDNYTGWTAGQSVSELFPISLDAIIVESSDDNTNVTR
ncbi:MAG: hypothetical protein IJS63_01530 [Bacteroidaceae bacterium]|nr:hypothetical protein [Bacteroidaceae bacterium]